MDNDKVKNLFQKAFDLFKEQFEEFITDEKKKAFSMLFKVKIDKYGNVYVDNIFLGINCKDCGDKFSFQVEVERIYVYINNYKTIVIDLDWANNREAPNIKNIVLETSIYSLGNE